MLEQAIIDLTTEIMLLRESLQQTPTPQPSTPPDAPETQQLIWLTPAKFGKLIGASPASIAGYRKQGRFRKSSYKYEQRGQLGIFLYHRIEAVKDLDKL